MPSDLVMYISSRLKLLSFIFSYLLCKSRQNSSKCLLPAKHFYMISSIFVLDIPEVRNPSNGKQRTCSTGFSPQLWVSQSRPHCVILLCRAVAGREYHYPLWWSSRRTGAACRLLPNIYRLQVLVIGVSANGAYTHRITIDNVSDGLSILL